MNLLDGYHNANWTGVMFSYEGVKRSDSTGFEHPARSITTTVVHAHYVPRAGLSARTVRCSTWKNYWALVGEKGCRAEPAHHE
jgi:hypothetical protein